MFPLNVKSEDATPLFTTPLFTAMGCANLFPGLTSGDEWVCERRQQHQAWWEASLLSYPVELVRLGQGGGIEKLLCGRGAVEIAIATLSQRRERIGPVSGVEADQNLQLKRLGAGEIHGRDESAHDAHERNGGWLPQEEVSLHFVAFFAVSKASVHVLHLFRSPVFSWLVLSSVADTNAGKMGSHLHISQFAACSVSGPPLGRLGKAPVAHPPGPGVKTF